MAFSIYTKDNSILIYGKTVQYLHPNVGFHDTWESPKYTLGCPTTCFKEQAGFSYQSLFGYDRNWFLLNIGRPKLGISFSEFIISNMIKLMNDLEASSIVEKGEFYFEFLPEDN